MWISCGRRSGCSERVLNRNISKKMTGALPHGDAPAFVQISIKLFIA